jgi:hypothetical protein
LFGISFLSLSFFLLKPQLVSASSVDDLSADVDKVDNAADKADDVGSGVLVFTSGAQLLKKIMRSV